MTARNRKTLRAGSSGYRPTERELAAIRKLAQAKRTPRVKVSEGDLVPDHPDKDTGYLLLMEAIGTADVDFLNGFLTQLVNVGSHGREPDQHGINFMLSVVKGIEPRDQVEAMLAAQMAAVHMAAMTLARRLAHVENLPQQDSAERAFNKLLRTFAAQMEALKRYRTGGEQKVTVQYVTVSDGGQAIVGNVTGPRGAAPDKSAASRLQLADAKTAPMPIIDEDKKAGFNSCVEYVKGEMKGNHPRNTGPMLSSQRCGARTRSGDPCRSPAVGGKKRCRMHGGAPGSGAPRGNRNAFKHGLYTREAIAQRRQLRELMRRSRKLLLRIE